MNQDLTIADVVNPQNQEFPIHAFTAPIKAGQNKDVMRDIETRATVLGPVLEEMFLYHWEQSNWEHWGLNE